MFIFVGFAYFFDMKSDHMLILTHAAFLTQTSILLRHVIVAVCQRRKEIFKETERRSRRTL